MAWEFERVAGPYQGPTGGVAWDGQAVLFSVMAENRVLRYEPESGETGVFRKYTSRTDGLAFSADGTLYGAQNGSRRIVRFNADGSASVLATRLDGRFHNHPQDLAVDRQGRIWFSDPYGQQAATTPQLMGPLEHASVLRLETDSRGEWHLRRMTYDTNAPAGVLVSPDQKALYVAESESAPDGKRELRAYPILDDGTLGACIVLHTFGADYRGAHRGIDGMCLDTEGNLVACAGWERSGPGPRVYVFSPGGGVLESHTAPAQPSNCAFGGADLGTLYVTAADGCLYRVRGTGRRGWALYPPVGAGL